MRGNVPGYNYHNTQPHVNIATPFVTLISSYALARGYKTAVAIAIGT